jgi:hypothetical protein
LKNQNFPSVIDEEYIDKLVEYLIKEDLNEEEQLFILDILFHAPQEYFSAYINELVCAASKHPDKWTALIKYAFDNRSGQIDDDIIHALEDFCKNEKSLATLGNLVEDENSLKYYNDIADRARETISKKNKGILGKIFGGISGSDDDK